MKINQNRNAYGKFPLCLLSVLMRVNQKRMRLRQVFIVSFVNVDGSNPKQKRKILEIIFPSFFLGGCLFRVPVLPPPFSTASRNFARLSRCFGLSGVSTTSSLAAAAFFYILGVVAAFTRLICVSAVPFAMASALRVAVVLSSLVYSMSSNSVTPLTGHSI